jgi:hypothetical protein
MIPLNILETDLEMKIKRELKKRNENEEYNIIKEILISDQIILIIKSNNQFSSVCIIVNRNILVITTESDMFLENL